MLPPALITPLVVAGIDIESSGFSLLDPAQTRAVTNKLVDAPAALDRSASRSRSARKAE
jgi:hypothetical protein